MYVKGFRDTFRQFGAQGWGDRMPEEVCGPLIGQLSEAILLGGTSILQGFGRGISKHTPVENQVDVFGEALNGPEGLGEAGAAFEGQVLFPGTAVKEVIQHPADPEVLLDDCGVNAHFHGGFLKKVAPVFARPP